MLFKFVLVHESLCAALECILRKVDKDSLSQDLDPAGFWLCFCSAVEQICKYAFRLLQTNVSKKFAAIQRLRDTSKIKLSSSDTSYVIVQVSKLEVNN